jgi:tagatose-1,6-bisphosphate aldolase non-catalytic subunit AgaZ/GatZ
MSSPSLPFTRLHTAAERAGLAPAALLVNLLRGPLADSSSHPGARHTLLAVCPNSEAVARAALRAAQEANTPLLYAATLNQVDRDGGYTGWTPATFADFVRAETERLDLEVPILLGLDHGGPWKKDTHRRDDLAYETTMQEVKRSITACVEAGYDLLHLDPTVDRRLPPDEPVPLDAIVERTIELMRHAEDARRAADRPAIAYEVGTEEVSGGLQSADRFESFLDRLDEALRAHDLPSPSFVVGDVGTTLAGEDFDADRARRLTAVATDRIGALLKGHYTDDVAAPEAYPLSGMGGANVGPGLSAVEATALRELGTLEERLDQTSGLPDALRDAVVDSGRWRKWLSGEEDGQPFEALPEERQRWLVDTGSRYVWADSAVKAARERLYDHVAPYRDADAYVQWRLKTAILHYMHAFNLIDLTDRVMEALPEDVP